jgi:tetratricopeptide (TPR) repeat protein
MDRDRLKEVHATDLTESRINEDFVDWLKTKAPNYLVIILLAIAGWMFFIKWQQRKTNYHNEAWAALMECQLPSTCEDVALQYADVAGLPQQARRQAADTLLQAVQVNRPVGATSDPLSQQAPIALTADERSEYLERADRLYREILDTDDGSDAMALHMLSAMQGRAVIAECLGDLDQTRHWYERAAGRAEGAFPQLAARLRERGESSGRYAEDVELPSNADLPQASAQDREPAVIDESLQELLDPALGSAG